MTLKDKINDILEKSLREAIADGVFPDMEYSTFKIEYPRDQKFGDYATPFAMESAKILRRAPLEIGEKLKTYIEKHDIVGHVDVVKPGYINMFVSFNELCDNLNAVIAEDTGYGRRRKEKPRNISIEFVSANPTGPMVIVSARAAALGDTIANLLEASGDSVEREFYVNDYGNQVNLLGRSVLSRLRELRGEPSEFPEDGYHGEYIRDIAAHLAERFSAELESIRDENELVAFCADKAIEYNVSAQKKDLEEFRVNFRRWFRERTLHESNYVMDTYSFLESKGVTFTHEGKKFFRSTDYNDDKDRVIIRDDGRPTYLLADIAYHRNKIGRNYDMIIDIWGPDHHGYIARLSGAVQAMGFDPERFKVLIAQQVNLIMEGETVKMSKRLGNFSTMRELIDEIGIDVARYFFLMRSMDSHLDFDLALARKSSSENPVFYLQYAHARICSIFREAPNKNVTYNPSSFNRELLRDDESVALMKLVAMYPEEIIDAAAYIEPHRIPSYLLRLAQAYHRFYTEHRVLTEDLERSNTYLVLSDAVRRVMRNGLQILGISAPEKM